MFMGPTLDFRKFLPPQHPLLQLASATDPNPIVPPALTEVPPRVSTAEIGAEPVPDVPLDERRVPAVFPPVPTAQRHPELKTELAPGATPDERTKPLPSTFQEELLRMFKDPKMQANLAQMVKGMGGAKAAPAPPPKLNVQITPMGHLPDRAGQAALSAKAMEDLGRFDLRIPTKRRPSEMDNYDILTAARQRRRRGDD